MILSNRSALPEQRAEILDLIAFRKNSKRDPRLGASIEFFSTLCKYTADGFFTSEIGIKYLGYIGNTYLNEFPGCPHTGGLVRISVHSKKTGGGYLQPRSSSRTRMAPE